MEAGLVSAQICRWAIPTLLVFEENAMRKIGKNICENRGGIHFHPLFEE